MPPTPATPKLCSPPLPCPVQTLRTHLTMRFTHLLVRRSHRGSCSVTAPDLADVGRGLPGKAEAGAPGVDPALGLPHPTPRKTVALWPSVCVADVMSVFPRDRRNCQSVSHLCNCTNMRLQPKAAKTSPFPLAFGKRVLPPPPSTSRESCHPPPRCPFSLLPG